MSCRFIFTCHVFTQTLFELILLSDIFQERCSNNCMCFVVNTEYEPPSFKIAQIRFIAQCRIIPSRLVMIKMITVLIEFNYFCLIRHCQQRIKQFFVSVFCKGIPYKRNLLIKS